MKSVRRFAVYLVILGLTFLPFPVKTQAECSIGALRWPLLGVPSRSNITRGFGDYWDSEHKCGPYWKQHTAIDYSTSQWSSVLSAEWGIVKEAYRDSREVGVIVIEHGYGCFTTVYWHVVPFVSPGSYVAKGQLIGYVGKPEYTQPHLHFGMRSVSYSAGVSKAGYLPEAACGGYPAFPERFINPLNFSYYW